MEDHCSPVVLSFHSQKLHSMLPFLLFLFFLAICQSTSDTGACQVLRPGLFSKEEEEKYLRARKQWCSLYPYYIRGICRQGGAALSPFNQLGPPGPTCQSLLQTFGSEDGSNQPGHWKSRSEILVK